ncbi:unnamed protein product [Kluyveromyces dobzhanskii CBS 2104]|uniref:WGS project CCBQ000000000 data, contig 00106 n=1 Tax=Kluyveromyces dobzhanskii CBS 2104 TaxID=1427455 RepID=A0A0A8L692_9SACH|nr:unnamed protein product [Kluyveromyces dobzhanskii CBS 2104]
MSQIYSHSNLDELLVSLLAEYKPHLQTHSHRMKSWSVLLREFNKRSGLKYRQTRTLKRRFDKLCSVYLKYGSVKVANFESFKQLVFEFEHERQKSDSATTESSNALSMLARRLTEAGEAVNSTSDVGDDEGLEEEMEDERCYVDEAEDEIARDPISVPSAANTESAEIIIDDNEENQTPLDSITLLPHTQMSRLRHQQLQENPQLTETVRENVSNSGSPLFANTPSMMNRNASDLSLQQQIFDLKNSFEKHSQREEESRRQIMYKLDYIVSLLKK